MKKKHLTIIALILVVVVSLLSGFIIGYVTNEFNSQKKIKKYQDDIAKLKEKIEKLSKPTPPELTFKTLTEALDYEQTKKIVSTNTSKPIKQKKIKTAKPKLVIIIDDVAFKYQINLIKQIPFKITPSFFPITKLHPYTPLYAKEFKSYMVHIPMEAFHFSKPEQNTLKINDSLEKIEKTISLIKKEFPRAKFINNHTGSKFTSNYKAMKRLFLVLKENNLGFVDSKTTPISKSYEVNKIYHLPLFSRNVFLDNKENKRYILNQLKKAIDIAKKRGYAIAIGHPHKITLETLKEAKNLLNQVDVIYIDELEEYAKN